MQTMNHRPPFCLKVSRCLILFALCTLPLAVARGQSATATLSGTVEDQNGAVIPNASVAAINVGTALQRDTTTDSGGNYTFPLLPPGTYIVRVQAQGFATVENRNAVLNVGDQKALRIQLKAGNKRRRRTCGSSRYGRTARLRQSAVSIEALPTHHQNHSGASEVSLDLGYY